MERTQPVCTISAPETPINCRRALARDWLRSRRESRLPGLVWSTAVADFAAALRPIEGKRTATESTAKTAMAHALLSLDHAPHEHAAGGSAWSTTITQGTSGCSDTVVVLQPINRKNRQRRLGPKGSGRLFFAFKNLIGFGRDSL
jgi:hypothetical protein